MASPGEPIKNLSDSDREKLGHELTEITRDLEREHRLLFDQIRVWWKWHDAAPKVERRSFPWDGASNIVVPIIRTSSDNLIARFFGTLMSNRRKLWVARSENERFAETHLDDILRFVNWAGRNEIDTFFPVFDWIAEMVPIGSSVLELTWSADERFLMVPGRKSPQKVVMRRGPKLRHRPRERIIWQPGGSVQDSEIVVSQSLLTWSDLARMVQTEGWDEEAVKQTQPFTHHSSPGAEIHEEKARRQGVEDIRRPSRRGLYDVRTAWVDWPLIKDMGVDEEKVQIPGEQKSDRISVPLVVEFCPDSKQVFRVTPNPYIGMSGWPFFETYFRKTSGYPGGRGVAKDLDHMQRGITTQVNQAIDAVTLSNAMPFITTDPKFRNKRITPGQPLYTSDPDGLKEFNIGKNIVPDFQILGYLQGQSEKAVGLGSQQFGIESTRGGHPSPATNFLGLMEQSQVMTAPAIKTLRHQWARIGESIATLYQQFDTDEDGRITRVFGPKDADRINSWLFPRDEPIPGNMEFDVFALSETENPQSEMQKAVTVSQMTQNYFASVLRVLPALQNRRLQGPVRKAIVKSIEALGKTHQRFLESADVDEAQELVFKLRESGAQDGGLIERFAALAREAEESGDGRAGDTAGALSGNGVGQLSAGGGGSSQSNLLGVPR